MFSPARSAALLLAAALLAPTPAAADQRPPGGGITYGIDASADALYTVDLTTGATASLGPAGLGIGATTPVSLAVRPGDGALFATNNSPSAVAGLLQIDPATGLATHIGGNVRSIAFAGNTLYSQAGAPGTLTGGALGTVDVATGVVTALPSAPLLPRLFALDHHPEQGILLGLDVDGGSSNLLHIGLDGTLLSTTALSQSIGVPGALVVTADGGIVGSNLASQLFGLSLDGVVSNLRNTDGPLPQGLGGVVPEPASLVLVGAGALALLRRRRR